MPIQIWILLAEGSAGFCRCEEDGVWSGKPKLYRCHVSDIAIFRSCSLGKKNLFLYSANFSVSFHVVAGKCIKTAPSGKLCIDNCPASLFSLKGFWPKTLFIVTIGVFFLCRAIALRNYSPLKSLKGCSYYYQIKEKIELNSNYLLSTLKTSLDFLIRDWNSWDPVSRIWLFKYPLPFKWTVSHAYFPALS